MSFDMTALLRPGLADGEAGWVGDPPFNFVGGHNDPASVPFGGFAEAAAAALARHGPALARYNLGGSPRAICPCVAIFEDDCYADLVFDGRRPPTIRSLDAGGGQVVYCGSFSKTLAPALRLGYIVADWPMMSRLLALKTDAGSGALEQIVVAEYGAAHFDDHVDALTAVLRGKCDAICGALRDNLPELASFEEPWGGIFVSVALRDGLDTDRLVAPAAARGVEFNPGSGWCTDPGYGASRMRLCFGHLPPDDIAAGIAALADVVTAELA